MGASATATVANHRTAVIDVGIDIERPAEAVFDYCSDHTNEIEWNSDMRRVAKLTEGPIGVGSRYEMEFLPGRPMFGESDQDDQRGAPGDRYGGGSVERMRPATGPTPGNAKGEGWSTCPRRRP